jgi:hypothetical protein
MKEISYYLIIKVAYYISYFFERVEFDPKKIEAYKEKLRQQCITR